MNVEDAEHWYQGLMSGTRMSGGMGHNGWCCCHHLPSAKNGATDALQRWGRWLLTCQPFADVGLSSFELRQSFCRCVRRHIGPFRDDAAVPLELIHFQFHRRTLEIFLVIRIIPVAYIGILTFETRQGRRLSGSIC